MITPDIQAIDIDELGLDEEETSTTWIMDESSKTIRELSDDRLKCTSQSIVNALRTERASYEMYSEIYGSTLHEKYGDIKPQVYAEIELSIKKCLANDDRIDRLQNFTFEDRKGNILVKFDVITFEDETITIEQEVRYD